MDMELIERLIGLVEASRVTELDFTAGTLRVRIERHGAAVPAMAAEAPPPAQARAPEADHRIAAGMAGTFFRAAGPGHAPFVSEGDIVQDGQTIAILEAMKMLNPVEADIAGRITRILVENGTSVAAGTPLFVVASPG